MANNIEIKDANGAITSLKTTELSTDVHSPHHIIQEISGSSITSVVDALNQISASVKTGGSVQTVTSSQASPLWITASYTNPIPVTGTINVDVQVSDLITVTASLSNPVGITGSTTVNNLAYTTYNASTYTSNVNAFTLVGSSSNRADVDANGSQKVGIFGVTNNRAIVDSAGSLQITGSTTVNNTSFTSYAGATHTANVTNIALIGSSSYKAEVDVSGSQKVGLFGSNNNRAVIDNLGSLQITGSTTINNLKDTSHSTSTYTGNVTPISLVGPSSYKAVIDSNGAQLVTSSQSTPLWISSSLSAPVGISGSVTLNNTSYTVYSGATHTGNVTNIALIGSSSYKAEVDVYGSQKVGIFGSTNNRAIVDSAGSLQITGSTTINNIKDTDHSSNNYSGKVTPIGLVGFSGNRQTVDSSGAALITGSSTLNNISYVAYNTSTHTSNLTPMAVVGPSGYRLQVDSSGSSIVTSSYTNPVVVTASFSQPLATKITSSNSDFPYIRHVVPTGAIRNVFSTTDSTINFNDGTNLGAFQIAANNINRKGLTITNPTSQRLFIAIATQASSSGAGRNGFDLPNNNYDPNSYSFIIYPSGSFFADSTNVSLFYGGFFVSSSATLKAFVTETY